MFSYPNRECGADRPWVVLANPATAGGALKSVEARLKSAGVSWRSHVPVTRAEGRRLAREISGRRVIAAVLGGDGTMNNIGAGLVRGRAWLAPLPGGTENLLCGQVGVPADPASAVDYLLRARPARWDVGRLAGRIFLLVAGVGFDGAVCAQTSGIWKAAFRQAAYALTVTRMLADPPFLFSIRCKEGVCRDAEQAVFSNGSRYGGGLMVNPHADPADGRLDMAVFRWRGHFSRIALMASLVFRPHRTSDMLLRRRVSSAVMMGKGPLPAQVDGEPFTVTNPRVSVIRSGLSVLGAFPLRRRWTAYS